LLTTGSPLNPRFAGSTFQKWLTRVTLIAVLFLALLILSWKRTPHAPSSIGITSRVDTVDVNPLDRGEGFTKFATDRFSEGLLEALVLTVLLWFLAEVPLFRSASLSHIRHVIGGDFIERASNPDSLRRLSLESRRKIELAVHEASLPADPPSEVTELLSQLSQRRDDLSVYRTDYVEVIRYEEIEGRPECRRMTCEYGTYTYKNATDTPQTVKLTIRCRGTRIEGLEENDYYRTTLLKVNGVDVLEKLAPSSAQNDDERVEFMSETQIEIPARGSAFVEHQYVEVQPKTEAWFHTFYHPVHRFDLTLRYTGRIVPQLYVFGLASDQSTDPLPAMIKSDGMYRWVYEGWYLRDQGMVLTLTPGRANTGEHRLVSPPPKSSA
jgi:hypothetical protein